MTVEEMPPRGNGFYRTYPPAILLLSLWLADSYLKVELELGLGLGNMTFVCMRVDADEDCRIAVGQVDTRDAIDNIDFL
jgi:hypothetical protein